MFRPPKERTVSEWADENRILPAATSAEPGRWRTSRAPYQREIMDSFGQPEIHRIIVEASSQVGKSEIELNMIGAAIEDAPGPMLYVQPSDETAEDYSKRRIAPMLEACPTLKERVAKVKGRDTNNTILIKQFVGGSLTIVSAGSPSALASKPVRYLFLDEVDRFPASAGTEGDPTELAVRRTETFRHNRKIVMTSSPTNKKGKIHVEYLKGTQEEWHTECPNCRRYSFIRLENVLFDHEEIKDEDGNRDYVVKNARWQCPICKAETGEHEAKRLPAKWVRHNEKALENGIRSFKLNAFMSPWGDWNDICRQFLISKDDVELLKVFTNTMLGECFEPHTANSEPEKLFARREHYNAEIPSGVLVLTCGIDTQDNRLEYEVVGWDRDEQSWGIEYGVIPGRPDSEGVLETLDELLNHEWRTATNAKLRIMASFWDSGGHFTDEVYAACAQRQSMHLFAVKGEAGQGKPLVRLMKQSKDGSGAAKFIIGVDAGKEAIMYNVTIEKDGPKKMHFPADERTGYGKEYFRGLLSERLEPHRKGGQVVMQWNKIYTRNEPLDCRDYARAAYRYFHWNYDRYEAQINGTWEETVTTRAKEERKRNRHIVSSGIKV